MPRKKRVILSSQEMNDSVKQVLKAIVLAGGRKQLIELLGVSAQYVSCLANGKCLISIEKAWVLEYHFKGKIKKEILRPDIFKKE